MTPGEDAKRSGWRYRLTLLDGVLLIAALACGMGITINSMPRWSEVASIPFAIAWLVTGSLIGGWIAGPIILVWHLLRERDARPTLGELLWLAPGTLYVATIAVSRAPGGASVSVFFWMFTQSVCSLVAFGLLFVTILSLFQRRATCWTDLLGSIVCSVTGPWFVYLIFEGLRHMQ